MSASSSSIPPEREFTYMQHAAEVVNEVAPNALGSLDQAPQPDDPNIPPSDIVQAAERLTRADAHGSILSNQVEHFVHGEGDLQRNYALHMTAAKGGMPVIAAAGLASSEQLAEWGNEMLAKGVDVQEAKQRLAKAQSWGNIYFKLRSGKASSQDVANYGNALLDEGMDPELAQEIAASAPIPKRIDYPAPMPGESVDLSMHPRKYPDTKIDKPPYTT